jgi:hypothetical protein
MLKRVVDDCPKPNPDSAADAPWKLDLQRLAKVDLTSEDAAYPIEAALVPSTGSSWRAERSGEQTIRLLFDQPQRSSVFNC